MTESLHLVMRPSLAVSILFLGLTDYISFGAAYSDRAVLGARLIRGIKTKSAGESSHEVEDTASPERKKQMKRIDALEDIFIGAKKIAKVKGVITSLQSCKFDRLYVRKPLASGM